MKSFSFDTILNIFYTLQNILSNDSSSRRQESSASNCLHINYLLQSNEEPGFNLFKLSTKGKGKHRVEAYGINKCEFNEFISKQVYFAEILEFCNKIPKYAFQLLYEGRT